MMAPPGPGSRRNQPCWINSAGIQRLALSALLRIAASGPAQPAGERCEMCAEPIGEEHQHVVNLESRSLMCTCRACYLLFTDRGPSCATAPSRPLPLVPGPSSWTGRSGTSWRSRWAWPSCSTTRCWGAPSLSIPARQAPRSRNCPWTPGPGSSRPTLSSPCCARHGGAADPRTRPRPGPGALPSGADRYVLRTGRPPARVWKGFDGGQESRQELAGFFDRISSRSRPAPAPPRQTRRTPG